MFIREHLAIGYPITQKKTSEFKKIREILLRCDTEHDPHAIYSTMQSIFSLPTGKGSYLLQHPDQFLALHELAAVHDGALFAALTIHYNLCLGTLRALDNGSDYVRLWKRKLENGAAIGVYLATELGYGNNVVGLEREAEYHPKTGNFILHSPRPSAYKFMPNTLTTILPKAGVVMARLKVSGCDYGIVPFLVPIHENKEIRPGITISPLGQKPGLALDNAMTAFDHVILPYEALLGGDILKLDRNGVVQLHEPSPRKRFLMAMNRVQAGKLCMVKVCLGVGKAALHITSRYGRQRQTFSVGGPVPLMDYHSFRNPLVHHTVALLIFSMTVDYLNSRLCAVLQESSYVPEPLKNEIAIAKAMASWRTQEIVMGCREQCGAQGLFAINKIATYYATVDTCITAEGDNLVILLKAARDYLRNPPKLPTIPDNEILAPLVRILTNYYQSLHAILKLELNIQDPEEHFKRWNKASAQLLEMVKIYGVLISISAIVSQNPQDDILLPAMELYLIDWHRRHSASLCVTGFIDAVEINRQRTRESEILTIHSDEILSLIEDFHAEEAGLATPISSNDYIQLFAEQHKKTCNYNKKI